MTSLAHTDDCRCPVCEIHGRGIFKGSTRDTPETGERRDCMDCGVCPSCVERSRHYFETEGGDPTDRAEGKAAVDIATAGSGEQAVAAAGTPDPSPASPAVAPADIETPDFEHMGRRRCPDGGWCHHGCADDGVCWRVENAAPLTEFGRDWNRARPTGGGEPVAWMIEGTELIYLDEDAARIALARGDRSDRRLVTLYAGPPPEEARGEPVPKNAFEGWVTLGDELVEALKPFAKYACDPPCDGPEIEWCPTCTARAALASHTESEPSSEGER